MRTGNSLAGDVRRNGKCLAKRDKYLAITYRPSNELKLDPRNPRQHSRKQIRQIAESINAFGFIVPALVNKRGEVIAGHARIQASKDLGIKEVPTICIEHLSETQARAFVIADNRLTEISTWNDQLLAEQLKELSVANIDFNIEATGFEMGEIDLRIQAMDACIGEAGKSDELPTDSGPPVSEPGDIWVLGRHRILCGSALDEASYLKLLGKESAAMVFTDPPYNVAIRGNVSGLGKVKHPDFAMATGEMSDLEYTAFLSQAFRLMTAYSVKGSIHYVCADWRHLAEYLAGGKAFKELKNLCVWVKDNGGMGSLYRSQHELVFVFKNGIGSHRNNVQLGQFGRNRSNVWRYPGGNSFSRSSEEGNLLALHPTVKPVSLVCDAILDCSARGDLILDPFLGSGTTVIAAERTGRFARGIELEPRYVDTAVRRWQAHTGDAVHHAITGRPFGKSIAKTERRKRHG